jgi:hypothetical protein
MTERRLTLFPVNPWVQLPQNEHFREMLREIDFLEANAGSDSGYILGRLFREILSESVEEMEFYHVPVWVEIFEQPRLQVGSDIQNLTSVKTTNGKEIGELDTAYQLIGALREDAEATWQDPRFGYPIPVYELDFENYLAFGNHFLQLGIYLKPSDRFLHQLNERLGIAYRYANYSE